MYGHFHRPKFRRWMTMGSILVISILVTLFAALVLDVVPLASQGPSEGSIEELEAKIDALQTTANNIEANLKGNLDIRSVKLVNFGLVGGDEFFQIRIFCSEAFQVNGVYATVRDPDGTIDVEYFDVFALGRILGDDFAPPLSWTIQHVDFDPEGGDASTAGYELLSQLEVEKPVGVAHGGSLDIFGLRISSDLGPDSNDTLSVGAVVETAQDSENACNIVIVDF
jgi:hypothetical protein